MIGMVKVGMCDLIPKRPVVYKRSKIFILFFKTKTVFSPA
jgi:hypothetical protein